MKKTARTQSAANLENYNIANEDPSLEYILPGLWHASRKVMILRGILLLAAGTMFLLFPAAATVVGIAIGGVYMIAESLVFMLRTQQLPRKLKLWGYLNSIILLLLGIGAIAFPILMGQYAVLFAGAWLLVGGIQQMWLLKAPGHRIKIMVSGIFSILAGIFLIIAPLAGLLVLSWLLAIMLWAAGCSLITAAYSINPAYQSEDI